MAGEQKGYDGSGGVWWACSREVQTDWAFRSHIGAQEWGIGLKSELMAQLSPDSSMPAGALDISRTLVNRTCMEVWSIGRTAYGQYMQILMCHAKRTTFCSWICSHCSSFSSGSSGSSSGVGDLRPLIWTCCTEHPSLHGLSVQAHLLVQHLRCTS